MIGQGFRPAFDQPLAKACAMAAGVVAGILAGNRLAGNGRARFGGFIEESVLIGHNARRQLPFPEGKRK
ncbi:hypothetical protein NTCA1_00510 [Novosphingobium sp. TCA1]|nr:hypothetical protein NTCA1_00510 [Novosphingobium sp. TCA1]